MAGRTTLTSPPDSAPSRTSSQSDSRLICYASGETVYLPVFPLGSLRPLKSGRLLAGAFNLFSQQRGSVDITDIIQSFQCIQQFLHPQAVIGAKFGFVERLLGNFAHLNPEPGFFQRRLN